MPRRAVPNDMVVEYYRQRAAAGLIIAEGAPISDRARGYINTPALWNEAQAAGWRRVTDTVHAADGKIFAQLWHCGRVAHAALHADGSAPAGVSLKPAATQTMIPGPGGKPVPTPCGKPEILSLQEIHGANGYLHIYCQTADWIHDAGHSMMPALRDAFHGAIIACSGFKTAAAGNALLQRGHADLIAIGKPFISNPDLVERLRRGAPLAKWDTASFYSGGEHGYTDYLEEELALATRRRPVPAPLAACRPARPSGTADRPSRAAPPACKSAGR
ncbi:MAG: hypothetical protein U1A72_25645 [Sulfuritalea sp.]|nr:hypothetical protein [Sulfuritalea sp.]